MNPTSTSATADAAAARNDFSADFVWGCATSSYQIEGATEADGCVESIWDRFAAMPGTIRDGSSGAVACDHYYRWPQDLDIARGLQPWATLYHWDLPQALQERGGWVERTTVDAFLALADAVTRRLGDRVRHWITQNEPWCTAMIGHYEGWHARRALTGPN